MSALLLLIINIIQIVASQNVSNACMWGRYGTLDNINGEFIFQGYFNNAPWYKKQYATDIIYMYFKAPNNYYIVSPDSPSNSSDFIYSARCTITTSYPWECAINQWLFTGTIDPEVFCQQGSCPEWNCDAITTDIDYMGCDDLFPLKVAANAWSNIDGSRFFYFNYIGFSWSCDEALTYTTEDLDIRTNLLAYADKQWINATKGSIVSLHFVNPFNQTQQIQCLSSNQLSQTPTSVPTINPTLFPSKVLAVNPTSLRSTEPHVDPTTNPSHVFIDSTSTQPTVLITVEKMLDTETENATARKQKFMIDSLAAILIVICGSLCVIIIITLVIGTMWEKERKKRFKSERNIAEVSAVKIAERKKENKTRTEDSSDSEQLYVKHDDPVMNSKGVKEEEEKEEEESSDKDAEELYDHEGMERIEENTGTKQTPLAPETVQNVQQAADDIELTDIQPQSTQNVMSVMRNVDESIVDEEGHRDTDDIK